MNATTYHHLPGKMPDTEIARMCGVTRAAVRMTRWPHTWCAACRDALRGAA